MKIKLQLLIISAIFIAGCGVDIPISKEVKTNTNSNIETTTNSINKMISRNNEIRNEVYQGNPISWNESIAIYAQNHADYLANNNKFEHSTNSIYGENIFMSSGSADYIDAVNLWYEEKKDFNLNTKSCNNGAVCGHYTQLIWQETTEVGCGKAISNQGNTIIVCQYNPAGNYIGEPPF